MRRTSSPRRRRPSGGRRRGRLPAHSAQGGSRSAQDPPPEQQQVLELAYFEGKTQVRIAEELGIPIGTVKTRTLAAMRKLRQALGRRNRRDRGSRADRGAPGRLRAPRARRARTRSRPTGSSPSTCRRAPDCRDTLADFRVGRWRPRARGAARRPARPRARPRSAAASATSPSAAAAAPAGRARGERRGARRDGGLLALARQPGHERRDQRGTALEVLNAMQQPGANPVALQTPSGDSPTGARRGLGPGPRAHVPLRQRGARLPTPGNAYQLWLGSGRDATRPSETRSCPRTASCSSSSPWTPRSTTRSSSPRSRSGPSRPRRRRGRPHLARLDLSA